MRRVQQATIAPFRCAVIPYMGNSNASGFIDTEMEVIGVDPHIYVSFEASVQIAKEIGWVGPSVVKALRDEVAALSAQNAQIEAELIEERRLNDSIEFLGTKDFIARHKRGPKKKEQEPTTKAAP